MATAHVPAPAPKRGYGEVDSGATLQYTTESFDYDVGGMIEKRHRAKKVEGEIAARDGARENDELSPICCKSPGGQFEDTPAPFAAGGHLVASVLSGSNEPQNLVPVSTAFNTQMKQIELKILAKIKEPEVVNPHLTVEVLDYYDDKDKRIPKRIQYQLKYNVSRLTDQTETVTMRHPRKAQKTEMPKYEFDEKTEIFGPIMQNFLVVSEGKHHSNLSAFLNRLKAEMLSKSWKVEDLKSYAKYVSATMATVPPANRPYAVLDYWFLVKNGGGYTSKNKTNYAAVAGNYKVSIGIGCEFAPWQKDLVRRVCYAMNSGFLKSDSHGRVGNPGVPIVEPHGDLIHGAAGSGDSYDHICPVAKDGSNLFSNCQITSSAFNSRKGSKF